MLGLIKYLGLSEILYKNDYNNYSNYLNNYGNLDEYFQAQFPQTQILYLLANFTLIEIFKQDYDYLIIDSAPSYWFLILYKLCHL